MWLLELQKCTCFKVQNLREGQTFVVYDGEREGVFKRGNGERCES